MIKSVNSWRHDKTKQTKERNKTMNETEKIEKARYNIRYSPVKANKAKRIEMVRQEFIDHASYQTYKTSRRNYYLRVLADEKTWNENHPTKENPQGRDTDWIDYDCIEYDLKHFRFTYEEYVAIYDSINWDEIEKKNAVSGEHPV